MLRRTEGGNAIVAASTIEEWYAPVERGDDDAVAAAKDDDDVTEDRAPAKYNAYLRALQTCEHRRETDTLRKQRRFQASETRHDHAKEGVTQDPKDLEYTLYRLEHIIRELNDRERRPFYSETDVRGYRREIQFIRETLLEHRFAYNMFGIDEATKKLRRMQKRLAADWNIDTSGEYNEIADLLMRALIDVEHKLHARTTHGHAAMAPAEATRMRDASPRHILHHLDKIADQLATESAVAKLDAQALHRLYMDVYYIHRSLRSRRLARLEQIQRVETKLRYAKMGMLDQNDYFELARNIREFRQQLAALLRSEVIEDDDRYYKIVEHANQDLVNRLKEENVLDLSMRKVYENFVLTWHKIFLELASSATYTEATDAKADDEDGRDEDGRDAAASRREWWHTLYRTLMNVVHIFTQQDRPIYVGTGLLIASFFAYYLSVSE